MKLFELSTWSHICNLNDPTCIDIGQQSKRLKRKCNCEIRCVGKLWNLMYPFDQFAIKVCSWLALLCFCWEVRWHMGNQTLANMWDPHNGRWSQVSCAKLAHGCWPFKGDWCSDRLRVLIRFSAEWTGWLFHYHVASDMVLPSARDKGLELHSPVNFKICLQRSGLFCSDIFLRGLRLALGWRFTGPSKS